jgi:lipopolysaccharide/colanic/teichoic acid biosynthesis glycosyltransferase
MVVNADSSGVDSTSNSDSRITFVGAFIRRLKIDELTQLVNVLVGTMSLVGPRPNVQREVDLYTDLELGLLSVKPGITDFSSVVFSDEGIILAAYEDPDLAYNQYIRPYKSELGLLYVKHKSFALDIAILSATFFSLFNRPFALSLISSTLRSLGVSSSLQALCLRNSPLKPCPPPGAVEIVNSRDIP